MSAYMVDKLHVDVILRVAIEGPRNNSKPRGYGRRTWSMRPDDPNSIGEMLIKENLSSIHARYPDTLVKPGGTPGPCDQYWMESYVYERPSRWLTAVEALKAVRCYEYQACEHEEWKDSQARQFCDQLTAELISTLPGYEDAPWGDYEAIEA